MGAPEFPLPIPAELRDAPVGSLYRKRSKAGGNGRRFDNMGTTAGWEERGTV